MKRLILLFVVISLFPLSNFAQGFVPSYPEVVKKLFSLYKIENSSSIELEKKKEGWFVVNTDTLDSEQIFWDASTSNFFELTGFEQADNEADAKIAEINYLNVNGLNRYMSERCSFYGYNGWAEDVINEFEGKTNLSDTLMEGLARAYFSYADGFLFHNSSYSKHTKILASSDYLSTELPEHKVLDYFELPSDRRIQLAIKYIEKSIAIWEKILKINPNYETLYGNARMTIFNLKMTGYFQMIICKKNEEAASFLKKIEYDEGIQAIGKKYLDACPQNSILVASWELDTYPLWYMQLIKNYRTDVFVIDHASLQKPLYIDFLKRSKSVQFRSPESFYSKRESSFLVFKEQENINSNRPLSLYDFLSICYSDKTASIAETESKFKSYPYSQTNLIIDPSKFSTISKQKNLSNFLSFQNGDYLSKKDIVLFDIIEQNINSRPIMFSNAEDVFKSYLQFDGILHQLLPLTENDTISKQISIANMDRNLNVNIQTLSYNLKGRANVDYDRYIISHFNSIISFYLEKGDKVTAIKKANEALLVIDKIKFDFMPNLIGFSELLLKLEQKDAAIKVLHLFVNSMIDNWVYPNSLKNNMRADYTEYYFEEIKRLTQTFNLTNLFKK